MMYSNDNNRYRNIAAIIKSVAFNAPVLVMLSFFFSCERRELYVYGDEFHSVDLEVDWRQYADRDPDGMTVWFYPLDDSANDVYRMTTANVRHHELYLPGGHYQGVVIDYSPEEYSFQQFLDIDSIRTARVEATMSAYQPDSLTVSGEGVPKGLSDDVNKQLYGEPAWTDLQTHRPPVREETGLYTVANQPEQMGLDTLSNKYVDRGLYGDYIPWQERETYQSTIAITHLYSEPETIVWKLHIRVWVRSGFNYLWQTPASITGLADGHFLPRDVITDNPCLLGIEGWDYERTGEDSGYISTTLNTFGLRPESLLPDRVLHHNGTRVLGDTEPDYSDPKWWDYYTGLCLPGQLRLNLSFTLRDHATTLSWHFNVGQCVVSYDEQLVLRIDLGPEFFGPGNPDGAHGKGGDPDNPSPAIDLPYVDAYNGTDFGAEVAPWEDMPPVDISF
ncbi:MAG: DUF5119 domain-containing protein [Prevotella sp.]|nr:DUF5119 domain-containing protein [Prevotella sp.]